VLARVSAHLEAILPNGITQVQKKLNEIKVLVKPYAVTLTPAERHYILKMGEKSFASVTNISRVLGLTARP
jgi:hypothetical protein